MSWSSTFKTTIPLGNCPIVPLSISNISVSRTSAVTQSALPYLGDILSLEGLLLMAMVVLDDHKPSFCIRLPFCIAVAEFYDPSNSLANLNSLIQTSVGLEDITSS
ncbi:hypothetical protein Tco_0597075 [Tanacetum coccineum]